MPGMAILRRFVARICNRRNAEGAINATDNTADYAADQAAKRSCRSHAHVGTVNDTVGDALRLSCEGESK